MKEDLFATGGLGGRISYLRKECNLTQEVLSKAAGISRATLALIEGDERIDIRVSTAQALASVFGGSRTGVTVEYLVLGGPLPDMGAVREAVRNATSGERRTA